MSMVTPPTTATMSLKRKTCRTVPRGAISRLPHSVGAGELVTVPATTPVKTSFWATGPPPADPVVVLVARREAALGAALCVATSGAVVTALEVLLTVLP